MTTTIDRARTARRKAKTLGWKMIQRGNIFELRDHTGTKLVTGGISAVENHLEQHYVPRPPGPHTASIPAGWRTIIADYGLHLAAGGQTASTIRLRRLTLAHIARGLNQPPDQVTAATLVAWFGQQTHWSNATRKVYRSTARGFLAWAYTTGRVPDHLGDHLPAVRENPPLPRPVPDQIWTAALTAADPRVTVMLRLAAEAGLRRGEIAQVHTDDLIDASGGPQLLVRGKGNKKRVVPISVSLAEVIRLGSGGHTPGRGPNGWLFPNTISGGHISPDHVSKLVSRVLPPGWSVHKLRHRYASRAYRASKNLPAVQRLLGHSSLATTQHYVGVDDDEVRAAAMAATL